MDSYAIRQQFLDYFQSKGHKIVPSSSLVPDDDPTLLFTNAGMNQFKNYFTGSQIAPIKTVATTQKCVRAGGKHNDLENVGFTPRHHTFFEMLGNFSFGDYFKEEAISMSWELLTQVFLFDPKKLYITVHHSDQQAYDIWQRKIGIPKEKIFFRSDKDNFWEMGDVGPCGPCSEIFYDHGSKYSKPGVDAFKLACPLDDEDRFIELWNLVFMQFEKFKDKDKIIKKTLASPSIDTGAGLERLSAALQGFYWNYDTDIFTPIIKDIQNITSSKLSDPTKKNSFYVLADHLRSMVMLISDGVIPSNDGRGHVLRRIIRRGVRHGKELNLPNSFLSTLAPSVFKVLGNIFPYNAKNIAMVQEFLQVEEKQFIETLDFGLQYLELAIKNELSGKILPGKVAFKLYDTYGFPFDLTETILRERNLELDHQGLEKSIIDQKTLSQKSWKGQQKWQELQKDEMTKLHQKWGVTKFLGYEQLETLSILHATSPLDEKKGVAFFNQVPFYAESGGQVGDRGEIYLEGKLIAKVTDTQKIIGDLFGIYYELIDTSSFIIGEKYTLKVDAEYRNILRAHHSATHLLQSALIKVLGPHVKQAGSIVSAEKLRFDFTHFSSLSKEQIKEVEDTVNKAIKDHLEVQTIETDKESALNIGAIALFGEKYSEKVRVIKMDNFSTEFCGGTHVHNTSQIQLFIITSEQSLAKGVRRIEGLAGQKALEYLFERRNILDNISKSLNSPIDQIEQKIKELKEIRAKEKNNSKLSQKTISLKDFEFETKSINNNYHFSFMKSTHPDIRKISDLFLEKFPYGTIFVYYQEENSDNFNFVIKTYKNNTHLSCIEIFNTLKDIIKAKGGGRNDFISGLAQDPKQIHHFSNKLEELIVKSYQ